tara:strand:+ start:880 stop:1116 length:237 start_codon:yes stop_codon:yes gene_type:complete
MFEKILLTVWVMLVVFSIAAFVWPGDSSNKSMSTEKEKAFEECLEAVQNKCASVIEYATMLEKENAKLNRHLKACKKK